MNKIMKKYLFLLGFTICTMTTMLGQSQQKEILYFKLGGSYFSQVTATEFPNVDGREPLKEVYVGGELVSRESITGSFGQGFRYGGNVGYRFTTRLGVEMGVNYYKSNSKTMVQTISDNVSVFKSEGQITAFDLAPAIVLYLGAVKGFEPYTKVGVIVPVVGKLEIETNAVAGPGVSVFRRDQINPNPTVGFQAALGTSYKIYKKISAFAELEYRNFTVHGKDKEVTAYTVNGVDRLNTLSTSEIHTNYSNHLDSNSNHADFNAVDPDRPKDDLSSYVSISGLGLTLGVRYTL